MKALGTPTKRTPDLRRSADAKLAELEMQNQALRESRAELEAEVQRYADLYDFAPAGYFTLEKDGTIRTLSLSGARLLAAERAEVVGRRFGTFVAEANRPDFDGALGRTFESKAKQACDVELVRPSLSPLAVTIETSLSPDGRECRVVLADLTARKRTAEALHASETHFRLLMEAVKDYAIFSIAPDGRVTSWNSGAQALKGYTAAEIVGEHFSVFYSAEDRERGKPALELSVAAAEGRFEEEGWRLRKDGSRFWANVIITPVRDAKGKLVGFAKVTRDLTCVRRLQQKQLCAEKRRALLESVAATLDGPIALADAAAAILTAGLAVGTHAVLVARTVENGKELELLHEVGKATSAAWSARFRSSTVVGDRRRFSIDERTALCDAVRSRSAVWLQSPAEIRASYPDYAHLFEEVGYRALAALPLIARDEVVGALRLSFSEERVFDPDDRAFLTAFARQCALALDRTLLYEDAVAARDLAERATMMRDELLSVVAHDLRNPLSGIALWAKYLDDTAPAGEAGEGVRKGAAAIRDGVRRTTLLIKDLGDVASIESGQLRLRTQEADAHAIVSSAVEALAPLAVEKELSLTGEAPSVHLVCDPNRVEEVLGNLVANAIKLTPERGRITIGAERSGDDVRFSVADTGPGIPEDAREHIFERYWRGRERDLTKGVGLGLFIAKGIVAGHGGKIWVDSALGRGSTFYFTIPIAH